MIPLPTDDNPVVIIHGDCLDILPQIPAGVVDAVVTDPPYGIGDKWDKPKGFGTCGGKLWNGDAKWDGEINQKAIDMAIIVADSSVVWGGNYYVLPPSRGYLIWDKMQSGFSLADSEYAWVSLPITPKTFRYARAQLASEGKIHPTQKPVALMRWCIQHLPKSVNVILDPFAGSGTTGVAAILEGRKAILIEKDAGYVEVIKKRIAETLGRPTKLANGKTAGRNLFESIRQESSCVKE